MNDEIELVASVKPEISLREFPPALDWSSMESDEPAHALSPASTRHRRWAWLAAAVAAALVVMVVVLVRPQPQPQPAAPKSSQSSQSSMSDATTSDDTPAAVPRLDELAQAAEASQPLGKGDVHYVKFTQVVGRAQGGTESTTTQYWIAPDTSGLVSNDHDPSFGPPSGPFDAGEGIQVENWCWGGDPKQALADARTRTDAAHGANGWMWIIQSCALSGPVSSTVQAVLLRELATFGEIEDLGQTTDSMGRPGHAIAATTTFPGATAGDRTTVVFDGLTGRLLAVKREITDPSNPAVIVGTAYQIVFQQTAFVTEFGAEP